MSHDKPAQATATSQDREPIHGQSDMRQGQSAPVTRRRFLGTLGATAALGTGLASPASAQETPVVAVGSNYYDPIGLAIEPGTTVRFEFTAGSHSVTAYEDRIPAGATAFDSGVESSGSFEYTFDIEGTYDYYCRPHQSTQVGRIIVGEPGGPAAASPIPDGAVPASDSIIEHGAIGIDEFDEASRSSGGWMGHDCSHDGMFSGGTSRLAWLVPAGALAGVVGLLGIALAAARDQSGPADPDTDEALAILQERYRRGELDREEFERRREYLRHKK